MKPNNRPITKNFLVSKSAILPHKLKYNLSKSCDLEKSKSNRSLLKVNTVKLSKCCRSADLNLAKAWVNKTKACWNLLRPKM